MNLQQELDEFVGRWPEVVSGPAQGLFLKHKLSDRSLTNMIIETQRSCNKQNEIIKNSELNKVKEIIKQNELRETLEFLIKIAVIPWEERKLK